MLGYEPPYTTEQGLVASMEEFLEPKAARPEAVAT